MLTFIMDECPRAPVPKDGEKLLLSHRIDVIQIWSDTVYMLLLFLASSSVFHLSRPVSRYKPKSLFQMCFQQIILAAEAL